MSNSNIKKPNLFIVGAPKCGTTSIYSFLKQHPEVYMSQFKEPHYFGSDLNKRKGVFIENEIDYLDLFKKLKNEVIIGEASTHYLFSSLAPIEIHHFNPNAKIIIALRNPTELIYSLHSQYFYSGNENQSDFEIALDLEKKRALGENNPPYLDMQEKVLYKTYIYKLPEQILIYKKLFKENVFFITLDELKINIEKTYRILIEFLNLDPAFKPNFEIKNANKIPRNFLLRDFIKKYGVVLGNMRKIFFKNPIGIMKKLENINKKTVKRKPMDSNLKRKLINEFLPVVNELENIINKDLSNWKK